MITLYTTLPHWNLPSTSPPCIELETWLRMAKLTYTPVIVTAASFDLAPKGKIPFIDYQGQLVGDVNLIIEMFKQKEGVDLDASLTPGEQAISLAFRRMLKENSYWGAMHIRYAIAENWQHYQEIIAGVLLPDAPLEVSKPMAEEVRKTLLSQLYNHGMGRHSREEIVQIVCADFQALSDFLADKPFLMGDHPTTVDATVYSLVGSFIQPPYESPIVNYIRQRSNLCQHYERMEQQFFGKQSLG